MPLEKAKIGEAIYDVITMDEYYTSPSSYGTFTAIKGEDGYVYPIRNKSDERPGFYTTGGFDFIQKPSIEEQPVYSQENIINFHNATSLREVIQTQQKLMSAERSILTTIDNVFKPEITERDTPEMIALKQAVIDKNIDLDKYEQRFGPNFNNDKRLFKKGAITFGKLRAICNALDIKATMIIEDASPDVPNPIGRTIKAELTGNNINIDGDE